MKAAWAYLKNQSKYSLTVMKKHKYGVAVTVKLACHKDIVAAEWSKGFSESD